MAERLGTAELLLTADPKPLQAGLQAAQRSAEQTTQKIGEQFTRTGRKIETAANGFQYFLDAQGRARQLNGQYATTAQQAAAGLDKLAGSARNAGSALKDAGGAGGSGGGGGGAFGRIAGTLTGLLSVGAVVAGLKSAVNAAVELETVTRQLSNTLGQQGAAGALGFTRQLSDQLGLSFQSLSSSFASFTAAATAANVPFEQQKELFAAVAKSGQSLGLSNDAINGSLLALQQVAAKGTVQMEELRGQLGERLPIAFSATARGLGISNRELIKLVESGKLSANQFFPALTKGLNELTAGSGGVKTAAQQFASLQNALQELNTEIGQSLLPDLVKSTAGLIALLKQWKQESKVADVGNAFNTDFETAQKLSAEIEKIIKLYPELDFDQGRRLVGDALKQVGGGNRNFLGQLSLSSEQLLDVVGRLNVRAKEFTATGREAAAQREREIAAANAELKAADALKQSRAVAAAQRNTASREQLANLLRTRGLQDEQLARAQDLLAVEAARRDVARAMLAYDDAAATAGGDPVKMATAANEIAEAQARVGIAIEEATRRAADRLKDAASLVKSSAEALRGAREGFAGAVGQAFAIATNEQRARARAINEERIRAAERAGAFDPARVAYRYGLGMQGGQLQLQSLTFRQLERLAGEVGTLANAEKSLQTAMTENTTALKQLAARKWEVQVNMRQNLGGDVAVNTINNLR
jgi:tape measure domain-containing protein